MSLNFSNRHVKSDYTLTKFEDVTQTGGITLTDTFEVFGDSLSDSRAPENQETWAMVVAQGLGKTVTGTGISGEAAWQAVARMYNTRAFGSTNSAALFIGTNDINNYDAMGIANSATILEQLNATVLTGAMFCSLPGTNKFNARNSIKTGTWTNTPSFSTVGVGADTVFDSLEQDVSGRFVSFTITAPNPFGTNTYKGEGFNYTITNCITGLDGSIGTISNDTDPVFPGLMTTAPRVEGGFVMRTYLFDTGVSGTHKITITYQEADFTAVNQPLYVDWFAGWDIGVQANTVLVIGVPQWQYLRRIENVAGDLGNDVLRYAYNTNSKQICEMLRDDFGLPVHYLETGATPPGSTCFDGLHMTRSGQRYFGNKILKQLGA